jgi:hypothetical protein
MNLQRIIAMAFGLLVLTACDPYDPTLHPDYAIRVTPTQSGGIAVAPPCPSWATETTDPYDNQPVPQFGCSDARNLAAQVEKPNDLIEPRTMGEMRGVTAVGAIRRYDNNQTRGLITTGAEVNAVATTTSSAASSSMSGDVTGGASASSSSSSSSSAGAAAGGP